MGMCISLTKNPMKPIIKKPTPVARAMAMNSFRSGLVHFLTKCMESLANCLRGSTNTSLKPSFSVDMVAGEWMNVVREFNENLMETKKRQKVSCCWENLQEKKALWAFYNKRHTIIQQWIPFHPRLMESHCLLAISLYDGSQLYGIG